MTYSKDDSLSGSELRRRYRNMPDDQLSASQLRAKAAIPRNSWKRPEDGANSGASPLLIIVALLALLLLPLLLLLIFLLLLLLLPMPTTAHILPD